MKHITAEVLQELYTNQRLSKKQVAENIGVSPSCVLDHLKKYGIPRRTPSECLLGIPKSIEHRQKLSNSKKGSKHPNFGKKCNSSGKRCWYTLPNNRTVSMRSRWEVWYAEYLREKGISFDYEPTTFTLLDGRAYTPDFLVKEEDEEYYVEVKGWLTPEHKKRIDAFRQEYPNQKLVLADKKHLEQLGIDLRKKWIMEKPQFDCELCQAKYHRSCPDQRFCSVTCRNLYISLNRGNAKVNSKSKRAYNGVQNGEKNNCSKLKESQVLEILRLRQEGMTLAKIAELTGASAGNVSNIIKGKSWKHVSRYMHDQFY